MSKEYKSIVILSILLLEPVIFGVWKNNQVNKLSDKVTLIEEAVEQAAAYKLRKALENCK